MESPWRRNFCIFIIVYYNVAGSSQNVPSGLPPSQLRNQEVINAVGTPPLLRRTLFLPGPDGGLRDVSTRTEVADIQTGVPLQNRIGPPLPPLSVPPQILQPLTLPPPALGPISQGPLGPVSLNPSYAAQGLSISPGVPSAFPAPTTPLIVPELPAVKCPPLALRNQITAPQPAQVPVDNMPMPAYPNGYLPSINFQQNFSPPSTIIPSPQPSVSQIEYITQVSSLPVRCPPLSTLSIPQPIPVDLPQGTATIIPTTQLQYPTQSSNVMTVLPDVNLAQSGYQVTVLPSVPTVQATSESVVYPNSYSNFPGLFGTDTYGQLPINVQITLPEQPSPMPLPPQPFPPPYAMPPIIVSKSGSSWKKWLPPLLVTMFSNCRGRGGEGCCCCSSCDCSDNVYIPFPIPVPTNNPIVVSGGSRSDDQDEADEGDLEYEDCED